MNAQNLDNMPKVKKESKNKIKVEFDRTPLKERLKAKFLSMFFLTKVIIYICRLVLLIGVSYIVLFPFFSQIAGSLMAPEDFIDATVRLIPKNFTIDIYKAIWSELDYLTCLSNTLFLSASTALIQTFICSFIAYGLAKFKFKGNSIVFLLVVFTLIVPHQTLQLSLFTEFKYFDVYQILRFISGNGIEIVSATAERSEVVILEGIRLIPDSWDKITKNGIELTNTYWPFILLSATGLAFKNGLYIFMLRQFFRGVPDELEESAYIDGSGVIRTFFKIILPISVPMMITVFLFAFSWQWTDNFYTDLFMTGKEAPKLMKDVIDIPSSLTTEYPGQNLYYSAIRNTCGLMIIAPLVVMYLFCQKYLVQGIERSGLTAD